ncbi:MAG: gliding motility-associated C-terminal domain-containing protein [Bacteroidales bacterium]|nr:gliding motility-associated C-terminal domain-containing protein [Bacteroidales bacterium]
MKKSIFLLLFFSVSIFVYGQSVLDFGTGSQVRNSVIFDNSGSAAVSLGISVRYSASDMALPAANNNIHLLSSPFSTGFQIDAGSVLFDAGNIEYLGIFDTLDLAGNPRIRCRQLDIGAFEHFAAPAVITVQPTLAGTLCEGSLLELFIEAAGDDLTFQWQRNGVDLVGATDSTFSIASVSIADTGYYRVIVRGSCYSDTSNLVRLDVDLMPMVIAMNDTTISLGQPVTLYVIDSEGTITWYESDMTTVVSPVLTNLTTTTQFFVVAENGVCAPAIDSVWITVKTGLIVSINYDDGCDVGDGWAEFVSSSGTGPFTFSWSTGSTDSVIENLVPGTYTLTVTDALGISGEAAATILPVVPVSISFRVEPADNSDCSNGNIFVEVTGGTGPFYFDWSSATDEAFMSQSPSLINVSYGVYSLLVTDSRGCTAKIENIEVDCDSGGVRASMLLTPNDDGFNDFTYIRNIELFPINRVTIINSYGEEIATIQNYNNNDVVWRGMNSRGQLVPDGTYYYIIEAEGMSTVTGWIIVRLSRSR